MSELVWKVYDKHGNSVYQGTYYECEKFVYDRRKTNQDDGLMVSNSGPFVRPELKSFPKDAPDILKEAAGLIEQRAAERDVEKERSMATAVKLFAEISGKALSEYEGWMFMACLKLARNRQGTMTFNRDHLLDGMAYLALALESRDGQ